MIVCNESASVGEHRRSARLDVCIPVTLAWGEHSVLAYAAVISRNGALIWSPIPFALDSMPEVFNTKTLESCGSHVVWQGGQDRGLHKFAVEFLGADHIWGGDYPA